MTPNSEENNGFSTPILILSFNRPESTRKLIESLRPLKPRKIYFAVDGPREGLNADLEKVSNTRAAQSEFNWPVELSTRFLDKNLGCKLAISSAIDWFFENEDLGIILEDDCIPTPEFLNFASNMLNKYRNIERIMQISGSSFFPEIANYDYNHYFSKLPVIWGWATWRRAWKNFEFNTISSAVDDPKKLIYDYYDNNLISKWFHRYYIESLSPKASAWSPHWIFSIIRNNGLTVMPMANMVRNIGMTDDSTHAFSKSFLEFDRFSIGQLPNLPDPIEIEANEKLDKLRFKVIRRTDPNTFLLRRAKVFLLRKIYVWIPQQVKESVKKSTSKSKLATKFLQK